MTEFNPIIKDITDIDLLKETIHKLEERIAVLEVLARRNIGPLNPLPGMPIWNPQPYQPTWTPNFTVDTTK